jgi:hypothetical protein
VRDKKKVSITGCSDCSKSQLPFRPMSAIVPHTVPPCERMTLVPSLHIKNQVVFHPVALYHHTMQGHIENLASCTQRATKSLIQAFSPPPSEGYHKFYGPHASSLTFFLLQGEFSVMSLRFLRCMFSHTASFLGSYSICVHHLSLFYVCPYPLPFSLSCFFGDHTRTSSLEDFLCGGMSLCVSFIRDGSTSFRYQMVFAILSEIIIPHL